MLDLAQEAGGRVKFVAHGRYGVLDRRMAALPHHREQNLLFLGHVAVQLIPQGQERLSQPDRGFLVVAMHGHDLLGQRDQPVHLDPMGLVVAGENVVDQGCDVATKSALQNIHIGDFNISDFQAANTVSTAADLNIDITGCAAGITGADVLFSGEADTLAPTLLKLTDTGGSGGMATGIAVQILDAQSQQEIPLNQVQPLTPLKAGDNTPKYQLRYKSTKAGATGGNATAVLYFDLVYQ